MPPKNTDLDIDETLDSDSDSSSESESKTPVDYAAKYRGLSRAHTRLRNKWEELQAKYDALAEENETKLSEAQSSVSANAKRIKELEDLLGAANERATKFEKEANKTSVRLTKAADITNKYPSLAEAFLRGDLRDVSEFEKPEDFDAYLERMTKLAGAGQSQQQETPPQDTRKGATPPGGGATRQGGSKKMTAMEIRDRLFQLDPRNEAQRAEYEQLMDALETAE